MASQVNVVFLKVINPGTASSGGINLASTVTDAVNSEQYGLVDDFIGWEAVTTPYYVYESSGETKVVYSIHLTYKKTI